MTDRKFTHPDDAPEGHEWVTVKGLPVRIYATDGCVLGDSIHGAALTHRSGWQPVEWTKSGDEYDGNHKLSIVDKPPEPASGEGWFNIYKRKDGGGNTVRPSSQNKGRSRGRCRFTRRPGNFNRPRLHALERGAIR